jgi:hypothetical protein
VRDIHVDRDKLKKQHDGEDKTNILILSSEPLRFSESLSKVSISVAGQLQTLRTTLKDSLQESVVADTWMKQIDVTQQRKTEVMEPVRRNKSPLSLRLFHIISA